MKFKDIEIGKCYLYDPDNEHKLLDTDMIEIVVTDKRKGFLTNTIIGNPVILREGIIDREIPVDEGSLKEMSENPIDNVVVRYPANIPVFSSEDALILANISTFAISHQAESHLTEDMMIKISSLVQKVKFYAEIAETYKT